MSKKQEHYKKIRLILGDQLNENHSWFEKKDRSVLYVLMEIKPESEYVTHHIQKIVGIFKAMRLFADLLKSKGHQVCYFKINDASNQHSFVDNLSSLLEKTSATEFQYQEPDEYRLDVLLQQVSQELNLPSTVFSTEHFLTERFDLKTFFIGKKTTLMESFYRHMRKKFNILMEYEKPIGGKWNYDHENRKKLPKNHQPLPPKLFKTTVQEICIEIKKADLKSIGKIEPQNFLWPVTRQEALELFDFFLENMLSFFGTFQDAMSNNAWSIYHSRISFAMNIKLIHPLEVIQKAEAFWKAHQSEITLAQVEGFIRQILGWREYMRGIYWKEMPAYQKLNYFNHQKELPSFFWTGKTKMNCLSKSIGQSLEYAYAHHIQRLMVTGNFALLAGIDPDEVDLWYLGIYIDAFEWVEITNTRGMSQYADGGIVGTKPYVSSGSYIHKMSDYCTNCQYDHKKKVGEKACPFNSLYWNFLNKHEEILRPNHRMSMMYRVWEKKDATTRSQILEQAKEYLENIDKL